MTKVTAGGIRSGEPEALAGLCKRRGGAVLVYSEHVAAPGQAGQAAADAFGLFRAKVVAADEPGLDAESLLLSATRQAAAARRASTLPGGEQYPECPAAALLVGWIEDTLSDPERKEFERHVVGCSACVDAVARFEAAERAYEHPPRAPVPASVATKIVGALVAAAPVTALDGDVAAVREAAERGVGADTAAATAAPAPAVPSSVSRGAPDVTQASGEAGSAVSSSPRSSAARPAVPRSRPSGLSRVREHGRLAGATMIDRWRVLAERGRAARPHPGFLAGRLRLDRGVDRSQLVGVGVAGVAALIAALVLIIPGDSPTRSGGSASSLSGESASPEAVDASQNEPQDSPPAATSKKPGPKTSRSAETRRRDAQAQRSAAAERAARAARERRAASRRKAAAAQRRRRAAATAPSPRPAAPTPARPPAAQRPVQPAPAPAPARREPARPTPAPSRPVPSRPVPSRPAPSSPAPSPVPGGEFTVGGET